MTKKKQPEEAAHALYSPSGAKKWLNCPGSLAMESTCPNTSSAYAAEGTAAHQLAEWTFLDVAHNTRAYLGKIIKVVEDDQTYDITVSEEMCEYIQDYVDNVFERIEEYKLRGDVANVTLEFEKKVDFSHVVNKKDQFGTVDVFILIEFTDGTAFMSIEDLKYGMGVPVVAEDNKQLKIYSLGALGEYDLAYDITEVNTVIHMIRKDYISEHLYDVEELYAFSVDVTMGASICEEAIGEFEVEGCSDTFQKMYLKPGDHCKEGFCRARGKCPSLAAKVFDTLVEDFEDLSEVEGKVQQTVQAATNKVDEGMVTPKQLSEFMNNADLIDDWLRAVRGRVEAELLIGRDVPEYYLAEGKKGNRAWIDSEEAEKKMKSMRIKQDQMYKKTLVTPTQAVKLVKGSVRKLNKLNALITQADGRPTVVHESSNRKPLELEPVIDTFDVIEEEDDFNDLA